MTATTGFFSNVLPEFQNPAYLKFDILANGINLTTNAHEIIFSSSSISVKRPIRTRSGSSGGLDLQLRGDIFVNAPLVNDCGDPTIAKLDWVEDHFEIIKPGIPREKAVVLPEPKFYSKRSGVGNIPMNRIAQMGSPDRLCYGMTGPKCRFWNHADRCRFCSIGFNSSSDESNKIEDQLYEVLALSMAEKQWPARHILIGGGTPKGEDMGALLAARLCSGIKSRFDVSVYVMIAAPLKNEYIDVLYNAGVDELGMNLEFWDESSWKEFIPGKMKYIGKQRYLDALEYAVNLFGPVRTRSILVAGLENEVHTMAAVKTLADMGVMPILSPFRPLQGTSLANNSGFRTERYISLYEEAQQYCNSKGLPLGPTCKCCQNNTLALPFGADYRWY